MSFTLLVGRKHFNHRIAFVAESEERLMKALRGWLVQDKAVEYFQSEVSENDHQEQASLKRYGNQCIQNCLEARSSAEYLGHLSAIAELYVQGYSLEFEKLFANESYGRIALPTYPFARESYWVSENNKPLKPASAPMLNPVHLTAGALDQLFDQVISDHMSVEDAAQNARKLLLK